MPGSPPRWLTRFLERWTRRPVAVLAWSAALLIAGLVSASRTPLEWIPSLSLPELTIHSEWPGATALAVEREVTLPIEQTLQRVGHVVNVESFSEPGRSSVRVEVASHADLDRVVVELGEQLARLRQSLPERVVPRLTRQVPAVLRDQVGFMTIQMAGLLDHEDLRRLAEDRVAPRIRNLPGVRDLWIEGGRETELRVELEPDRLRAYGLDSQDVLGVLFEAFGDRSFGAVRDRRSSLLLYYPGPTRSEEIAELALAETSDGTPIRLRNVARIGLAPARPRTLSRVDGEPVVSLVLDRTPGSHLLRTATQVRERLAAVAHELPPGVRLRVASDRSRDIRSELRDLIVRGIAALVLVVVVLVFMLRSLRATLVVLYTVTLSLMVSLGLLAPFGLTFNVLTLAGLVLVVGLLVDNSVVVVEEVQRRREDSCGALPRGEDLAGALQRVWLPLLAGTLSTTALLGPLVYLSGDLRQLFLPLGIILGVVLLFSLATAVLLLPVLARWIPGRPRRRRSRSGRRWRRLMNLYALATRWPRATLVVCVLVVGLPLWWLPLRLEVPKTPPGEVDTPTARAARLYNATAGHPAVVRLRPELDRWTGGLSRPLIQSILNSGRHSSLPVPSELMVALRLPPGSDLERIDELLRSFERLALRSAAVERTMASVRDDGSASLRIAWHEEAIDSAAPLQVRDLLIEHATRLTGVRITIHGLVREIFTSGGGTDAVPFVVAASGSDYNELEEVLQQQADHFREHPRVSSVEVYADRFGRPIRRQVVSLRPHDHALLRGQADATSMAALLRTRISGSVPILRADVDGRTQVPVRVSTGTGREPSLEELQDSVVPGPAGSSLKVGELVGVEFQEQPSLIERQNQQYRRYLTVTYRGPYKVGSDFLDRELAAFELPTGIRVERIDLAASGIASPSQVGWMLLGTTLTIFLVIAAACESWSLAALVISTLPMAAAGVGATQLATGSGFGEGSFIGLLLLLGIAVNDHILLVDRYRKLRLRRPGEATGRLALLALSQRLHPMWTTTLTTVAGVAPLMVAVSGSGGRFWASLAWTVLGGLVASTLLGPLVPVSVLALSDRGRPTLTPRSTSPPGGGRPGPRRWPPGPSCPPP